jgi:Protein of unknown function (DUF2800)
MNTDDRLGLTSCSEAPIRYRCLGMVNLKRELKAKGMLQPVSTPAAQLGTDIHAVRSGEQRELSDKAEDTKETLDAIEKRAVEQWANGEDQYEATRENRIYLYSGIKPIYSGRYDYSYWTKDEKRVLLMDDKSGRVEVDPAERNLQLRDMASIMYSNHKEYLEEVTVGISQPWITWEPSLAKYEKPELERALYELRANLEAIKDPGAPRTPGWHCRHCACKAWCPEVEGFAVVKPSIALEKIRSGELTLPTGEQGQIFYEMLKVGKEVIKELEALFVKPISSGEIPGWQMHPGKKTKEVTNLDGLETWAATILTEDELKTCKKIGFTKLKDLFVKKRPSYEKVMDAEKRFVKAIEPFITENEGEPYPEKIPTRGKRAKKEDK